MQTTTPSSRIRVLVGSTAGRGPCEDARCGLIAELHLVEETVPYAPGFSVVRALCLPHALGAGGVAPLHLVRREA